ncbi:hypothetical protein C482_14059 [Natrialba chahannaoensis JCM 10990]|uniref:GNAT family acetyltransferase n=1 Tax=Natrialba chahannaoensis JCM 10990 TaxID=1227492 RepID=M0AEU6_9EURY|nr:DUF5816 domain-containing protein [Natrialba chahannaoensis]ELY97029.1 hypothetical protein C482_14059 [Natrialba chahannaoensis JCM 10990]
MRSIVTEDGDTVFVSQADGDTGSKGPFLVVYETSDADTRYGWFCTNCEGVDNAMDSMGRIKCNRCGNFRKPTEWDAAHE